MATVTSTDTVKLTMLDSSGKKSSINMKNPTNDGDILDNVSTINDSLSSGGLSSWWYSDISSSPYVRITNADVIEKTILKEETATTITQTTRYLYKEE